MNIGFLRATDTSERARTLSPSVLGRRRIARSTPPIRPDSRVADRPTARGARQHLGWVLLIAAALLAYVLNANVSLALTLPHPATSSADGQDALLDAVRGAEARALADGDPVRARWLASVANGETRERAMQAALASGCSAPECSSPRSAKP